MIQLSFIRHGQSEANVLQIISGQTQTPLSQYGIQQLQSLKDEIQYPEFDLLFSSDLSRAIDTAKTLFNNQEPIQISEFREINFGDYEGQSIADYSSVFYDNFLAEIKHGEMETYLTLRTRVSFGIQKVFDFLEKEQKNRATIVAHNGLLRMVHHMYKPTPIETYRDFQTHNGHGFKMILESQDSMKSIEYF